MAQVPPDSMQLSSVISNQPQHQPILFRSIRGGFLLHQPWIFLGDAPVAQVNISLFVSVAPLYLWGLRIHSRCFTASVPSEILADFLGQSCTLVCFWWVCLGGEAHSGARVV